MVEMVDLSLLRALDLVEEAVVDTLVAVVDLVLFLVKLEAEAVVAVLTMSAVELLQLTQAQLPKLELDKVTLNIPVESVMEETVEQHQAQGLMERMDT